MQSWPMCSRGETSKCSSVRPVWARIRLRDTLEVTKGSRAWLIVDLADGRIPPMTAAAKQRIGPADPFQDTGIQGIATARARTEQLRRGFIVPRD